MDGDGTTWTVGEVAQRAGVSVRTLHHWDAVGLLVPSARTAAGYRSYGEADLARLARVLTYRALGFGLDAVAALLADETDPVAHLRRQHELLSAEVTRLQALAVAVGRALEAWEMGIELEPHELLEVFGDADPTVHAAEAQERWGDSPEWGQSAQRTRSYRKADWLAINAEREDVEARFAATLAAGEPADGPVAQGLAGEHRAHIARWFYECSPEVHRGLGELYVTDERFAAHYDGRAPGLARYVHDAIHAQPPA